MIQYNVTGMTCAACSSRVEKAVSKVPGVTICSVSLLTNSMGIEGTASPEEIVTAVEHASADRDDRVGDDDALHAVLIAERIVRDRLDGIGDDGVHASGHQLVVLSNNDRVAVIAAVIDRVVFVNGDLSQT